MSRPKRELIPGHSYHVTVRCNNREFRHHSTGFANDDQKRALNTLRYIHANPKAAGMQQGFFYDFSNYGVHDRLGDDGLTQWHPAFLSLGKTLDECAEKYRGFCKRYKPKPKPEKRNHWGSKLLSGVKITKKGKKAPREQLSLWEEWEANSPEIVEVADQFIFAN